MLLADKIFCRSAAGKRLLLNKLVNDETDGIWLTITVQVLRSHGLCWMWQCIFHYAPFDARSNNRSQRRTCSTRCTHTKALAADNFLLLALCNLQETSKPLISRASDCEQLFRMNYAEINKSILHLRWEKTLQEHRYCIRNFKSKALQI